MCFERRTRRPSLSRRRQGPRRAVGMVSEKEYWGGRWVLRDERIGHFFVVLEGERKSESGVSVLRRHSPLLPLQPSSLLPSSFSLSLLLYFFNLSLLLPPPLFHSSSTWLLLVLSTASLTFCILLRIFIPVVLVLFLIGTWSI